MLLRLRWGHWCSGHWQPLTSSQPRAVNNAAAAAACGFGRTGSVDSLGQGHDDSLRPAHVGHAPDVLVLTDAANQAVAVRSQPVDNLLEVVQPADNISHPYSIVHAIARS